MEILAILAIAFIIIYFGEKIKLAERLQAGEKIGGLVQRFFWRASKKTGTFLLWNFGVLVVANFLGTLVWNQAGLLSTQLYYGLLTGLALLEALTRKKTKPYKPAI